mgnify:CR=1 FL=1
MLLGDEAEEPAEGDHGQREADGCGNGFRSGGEDPAGEHGAASRMLTGELLTVSVTDDGPGVPPELKDRLGLDAVPDLGIVIDDAIVVLENIYRHRALGEDRLTASINGPKEVAGAITAPQ